MRSSGFATSSRPLHTHIRLSQRRHSLCCHFLKKLAQCFLQRFITGRRDYIGLLMEEKPLCQQYLKAVSIKGDGSIQRTKQQLLIIIVISGNSTISKHQMENHGLFSSIRIKVANLNSDDITAEQCQRSSCTLGVTRSNEHTRSLLTRTKTTGRLETVSSETSVYHRAHPQQPRSNT